MSANFADKNILIADNSALMTRMIKSFLVKAGFNSENITTAIDGHQALMFSELIGFHLVTLGLHMRVLDGVELLERLRKSSVKGVKEMPLLLITCERKEALIQDFKNAGGNGYLSKPFTIDNLVDTVNKIFNHEAGSFVKPQPTPDGIAKLAREIVSDHKVTTAFIESALQALGQYTVSATAGEITDDHLITGDYIAWVELTDKKMDIRLVIMMQFPKTVVCDIYENIVGAVDMDAVCGVVEELVNIIAGISKSKLSSYYSEIYHLVHPNAPARASEDLTIDFEVGLPFAKMAENLYPEVFQEGAPKFTVPFIIKGEKVFLEVSFQKF